MIAEQDSARMQAELQVGQNTIFLPNSKTFADFVEGEIITIECEWAILTAPHTNVFFIYTKYHVTKEKQDEQPRNQKDANQAADSAAQAVNERTQGGERSGQPSVG